MLKPGDLNRSLHMVIIEGNSLPTILITWIDGTRLYLQVYEACFDDLSVGDRCAGSGNGTVS